ncbi:glycosyltransferase family 2 protein [Azospirillum sp. RWY-5-1]|uniref:Glycosyltransferase family 2 protein n=1 Tax=Azospirillum oleiclasticum TaxID=2735135 RepID=A0ABX2TFZ3_9PROT|nr:glycosyltransferase family 2 protein [Azospirillum oleiclasticum]NYZ23146.1 glycosyltransferase family 2 protein [Azospirillum oleiclasticum]
MQEFLRYFVEGIDPFNIIRSVNALPSLPWYNALFVLCVIGPLVRYQGPIVALWLANLVVPHRLFPPPPRSMVQPPLVSVVIAGRNEAAGIAGTIRSLLGCSYPRLEIIVVDDCSTDDTFSIARSFEGTGHVRCYRAATHSGKPSCLNIGIQRARGEFIMIVDADADVQIGAIHEMLIPFDDPKVGAVTAHLRVRNARDSFVTRMQEIEYAFNVATSRLWRSHLGILSIIAGAGGMFRAGALRLLGGYDTGLGDDTDVTMRLRKAGWTLRFAPHAIIWVDCPATWRGLIRQRSRWERNMIKIRLRKQIDILRISLFGYGNFLMMLDQILVRFLAPMLFLFGLVWYVATDPFTTSRILTFMYWIHVWETVLRMLAANDVIGVPRLGALPLAPFLPLYRLILRLALLPPIVKELLRIGLRHGYVPEKIWRETPHW